MRSRVRPAVKSFLCLLVFFAGPAHAQFGVDGIDEPAPVAPPPATQSQVITLEEAIATMREYQASARNDDAEYFLSLLAEPLKSDARDVINKKGLPYFLMGKEPLLGWQIDCGACWDDPDEDSLCVLTDRRETPKKRNSAYFIGNYMFKKVNGVVYMTENLGYSKRFRSLKKKMKKNNRICDIDGKFKESRDGSSSLVRGLGDVIGEIAQ